MRLSRTKSVPYTLSRLLFAVLGLGASAITSADGANTCSDCSRMAFFAEMHNLHNPDWEAQNQAWNDCMTRNLPEAYVTFEDDKLTRKAETACKKFELNSGVENRVMHESSVRTRIWMLTSPCFHLSTSVDTSAYRIESTFEAGLADAGVDDVGRAVKSVFKILLFQDETNDLIKSWETRSHNNNIGWHYNTMFNNDDAVLKADRNIEPYLREYEKLPARASFVPDCKVTLPGKELTLSLQEIVDEEGETSREFNRVIVCATKGKILNGSPWNAGPDCRVFRVGAGNLEIDYLASGSCDVTDTVRVYNSCDILSPDKLPLSGTQVGNVIAEAEVKTVCGLSGSFLEDRWQTEREGGVSADRLADIALDIDFRQDPPLVTGEAVATHHSYSRCTISYESDFWIKGALVCRKGEEPALRLMRRERIDYEKQCCQHAQGHRCSGPAEYEYEGWGGFSSPDSCQGENAGFDELGYILLPIKDGSSLNCSGIAGEASLTLRLHPQ